MVYEIALNYQLQMQVLHYIYQKRLTIKYFLN